jgi:two-component system, chemotaxis family, sensor kinase CheA
MDVSEYAELFQAEAGEYMQVLNQCLLNLEKDPKDREELLESFRVVHSLKGMAGTMGYKHVTDIAHGLENFMEDFKTGERKPCPDILDMLFEAVDLLQLSLEHPEESPSEDMEKWNTLLVKMKNFKEHGEAQPEPEITGNVDLGDQSIGVMDRELLRQAVEKGQNPCRIKVNLRKDTMMKAVRVYMIFKALEELGEIILSLPSQQDLEEENFEDTFEVILSPGDNDLQVIQEKIMLISDVEEVLATTWSGETAAAEKTSETEPVVDKVISADPEVNEEDESANALTEANYEPAETTKEAKAEPAKPVAPTATTDEGGQVAKAIDKMVRVETQKLDDLVNLVGEMVVARTRITEIGRGFSEDLDSTIDQLKRSITNLQDTAMGLRMVPIKQVFERFPRMVRDLCRDKGKKVQLYISGEETELDRSIINRLSDPLVHLLRNSFDHGIEAPDERKQKGKNPEGSIHLKACHEGNQVVITVEDDGAGIDPEKIGEIAVKKGVISRAELNQLSKEDKVSLIFFNGFSTSAEITDVSGRGVGMDAVRNSIESLHGTVEVYSEVNVMTRFVMRLPLTLAIIKTLLVRSSDQLYAIPVEIIHENVYLSREEIRSIRGNPVVNLRGEVIPLYYLSSLLGFSNNEMPDGDCSVVIVEAANRKAGFVVEELVGQQEIMIKSLGSFLKGLKGIAGATVLGDGSVTLIIDVAGLLSEGREYIEQNSIGS